MVDADTIVIDGVGVCLQLIYDIGDGDDNIEEFVCEYTRRL